MVRTNIYFPSSKAELHKKILNSANDSNRSLNEQIITMLEVALDVKQAVAEGNAVIEKRYGKFLNKLWGDAAYPIKDNGGDKNSG